MQHTAMQAASTKLGFLDLPDNCLYHIVSFMDAPTRELFFRLSKGTAAQPGCALLLVDNSKPKCRVELVPGVQPELQPAPTITLHWVSNICSDMQLTIHAAGHQLVHALRSLLRFEEAQPTGVSSWLFWQVHEGIPATYPGVTCLSLEDYVSPCIIPAALVAAFPNLKRLELDWSGGGKAGRLGPVLQAGTSSIQQLVLSDASTAQLDMRQHITQQLARLPGLTTLEVYQTAFVSAPPTLLHQLTCVCLLGRATASQPLTAAFRECTRLHSLTMSVGGGDSADGDYVSTEASHVLYALGTAKSPVRAIHLQDELSSVHMPPLLALTQLTELTADFLFWLNQDHSTAPRQWTRIQIRVTATNDITKLPLNSLDSPVACQVFKLRRISGFMHDLAAIRAAQPHLIRCGGIVISDELFLNMDGLSKQQAEELLEAWAPCFSVVPRVRMHAPATQALVQDCVSRLWPGVTVKLREWWG